MLFELQELYSIYCDDDDDNDDGELKETGSVCGLCQATNPEIAWNL